VRELCNVLERGLIVAGARQLDVAILRDILEPALAAPVIEAGSGDLTLRTQLDAAEKELVLRALARAGNLKKQAAYMLGIDPRNLGYYLRKHGLS
jgi:two-component system response regulator PilR (NtrC family)